MKIWWASTAARRRLDPAAEPVDVRAKRPVVGDRSACVEQRRWSGRRVPRRRRCGRRRTASELALGGGELGRTLVGRGPSWPPRLSARLPAASIRRPRPRRARRTRRPGARSVGRGLRPRSARLRAPVRGPALRARGGLVDRGPDQGVSDPELAPSTDEESGPFDRRQASRRDGRAVRPPGAGRELSGVIGRGKQHQGLAGHRRRAAAVEERPLHPVGQGQLVRSRGPGELCRR